MLQTANRNTVGMTALLIRDDDDGTCFGVPLASSPEKYLKVRLTWPDLVDDRSNPSYQVFIKGHHLVCDSPNIQIYMKVTAAWGAPSFEGKFQRCAFFNQIQAPGGWHRCDYVCHPGPYYSEATFIFIRNVDIADTTLCEVRYWQNF